MRCFIATPFTNTGSLDTVPASPRTMKVVQLLFHQIFRMYCRRHPFSLAKELTWVVERLPNSPAVRGKVSICTL